MIANFKSLLIHKTMAVLIAINSQWVQHTFYSEYIGGNLALHNGKGEHVLQMVHFCHRQVRTEIEKSDMRTGL